MGFTQSNKHGLSQGEVKWCSKALGSVKILWSKRSEKVRMKIKYKKLCSSLNRARGCRGKGPSEIADMEQYSIHDDSACQFSWFSQCRMLCHLLQTWSSGARKSDEAVCPLCWVQHNFEHVLSAGNVVLGQGQFMWHQNLVLKELGAIVDVAWLQAKKRC